MKKDSLGTHMIAFPREVTSPYIDGEFLCA